MRKQAATIKMNVHTEIVKPNILEHTRTGIKDLSKHNTHVISCGAALFMNQHAASRIKWIYMLFVHK